MNSQLPSPKWIIEQCGEKQVQFFEQFVEAHLGYSIDLASIPCRTAPSLIARSECELLSISSPRFAIRAILPDASLIHLRRLSFLNRCCRHRTAHCDGIELPLSTLLKPNLSYAETLLADSVLIPPEHALSRTRWHVLTAPLHSYYDDDERFRAVKGTPFLQQMILGGGMCAQAACFMANAALIEHAQALFGVAEITALTNDAFMEMASDSVDVSIGGMNIDASCRYFRNPTVGLGAFVHRRNWITVPRSRERELYTYLNQMLLTILRSYILSDCPVIVHFDYRTLASVPDYKNVSTRILKKDRVPHAAVIVGCSLENRTEQQQFALNDPSYLPFRRLQSEEMLTLLAVQRSALDSERYMPCTAPGVVLPLTLDEYEKASTRASVSFVLNGLRHHPDKLVADLVPLHLPALLPTDQFRLFQVRGKSDWPQVLCRGDSVDPYVVGAVQHWLKGPNGTRANWLWSAHRRNSVRNEGRFAESFVFIDASTVLSGDELGNSHNRLPLLSVTREFGERWSCNQLGHRRIGVSSITSFLTCSSTTIDKVLPSDGQPTLEGIEWYVLMQTDVETSRIRRFARKHSFSYDTAVDFMAYCGDPANQQLLDEALDEVMRLRPRSFPIIAFATFVPSLSLPPDTPGATGARHALRFLAHLGARFHPVVREQGGSELHRRMVIELVAGSRIVGISSEPSSRTKFRVSYAAGNSAMLNFVANLQAVVEVSPQVHQKVVWAVELEPGPLFTVNDFDSLCTLCDQLRSNDALNMNVGINLDIAHLRMSRSFGTTDRTSPVTPEMVRNSPIFSRIAHAHISGHDTKAHFGDRAVSSSAFEAEFLPWIELLRNRAEVTTPAIPFSGFVSVELEASKGHAYAVSATKDVAMMIARHHM